MKFFYLVPVIFIHFLSDCQAQVFNSLSFDTGLYFGKPCNEKNVGQFANSPFKDVLHSNMGFTSEVIVFSNMIHQRLAFGTGIKLSQANYEHTVNILTSLDIINGTRTQIKNDVSLTIVGIPIICKFDLLKNNKLLQAIGGFGFYRSFNKVSENTVTGSGKLDPVFSTYRIDDIDRKYNISSQLGLKVLIKMAEKNYISISGRFEYFMIQDKYYENGKGNMRGIILSIGYIFESKK